MTNTAVATSILPTVDDHLMPPQLPRHSEHHHHYSYQHSCLSLISERQLGTLTQLVDELPPVIA